jgi:hypothetical protein
VLILRRESCLQFQLQDILAVMVGYGMAALLFRAFWPESRPSPALGVPALGLYLWLGMAMSGPILMLRRRSSRAIDSAASAPQPSQAHPHTWAELAWALIGAYWIVVGIFAIPSRLHEFRPGDMLWFGMVPLVVALTLRVVGPGPARDQAAIRTWTHGAAVVLLATWPIAWICLIVLGWNMR